MSVVEVHGLHRLCDAAKLYAPFIVASFVGYVLSSHQGLRVWIALQKTTTPSPNEVRNKKFNPLVLFIFFLLVGVPAFFAGSGLAPGWAKLSLLPILSCSTLTLFAFLTGWLSSSVHRTADGVPSLEVRRSRPSTRWVLILAPLVVTFAGVFSDNVLYTTIPLTAFIFTMCRGHLEGTFLLSRWLIVILATWFVMLGGLAIVWVALVVKHDIKITYEQKRQVAEALNKFGSLSLYWQNWMAPSFLVASLSPLFSSMLRFDYHNHREMSANPNESEDLAVIQPKKPSDGGLPSVGPGIALPERAPRNFAKPYFYTAVVSWLLTQLVCVVVGAFIDSDFVVPRVLYVTFSVPVVTVTMSTSLLIVAAFRGELGKLWRYTEVWTVRPTDAEARNGVAVVEPAPTLEKSQEKAELLV